MSRTRKMLFGATSGLYAVIVWAVLVRTDLVRLDWQVMLFRPYKQWPEVHALLDYFVVLGQRGPTAVLVMAWLGWRSWRQRTLRPLLVLGTSLLLLNVTVGAVKIGLGRLGPHYATTIGSAELFADGDIFPSGHTANAVVTWGILAYLATTPRARRVLSVVGAVAALGVGATTVYLGTHWVSDVLLGWAAGLLILLGLPWCEPLIARAEALIFAWRSRLRALSPTRPGLAPEPPAPVTARSPLHPGTPSAPSAPSTPSGLAAAEEAPVPDGRTAAAVPDTVAVDAATAMEPAAQPSETAGIASRVAEPQNAAPTASGSLGHARLLHGSPYQPPLRAEGPRRPHPADRTLPRTAPLGPWGK